MGRTANVNVSGGIAKPILVARKNNVKGVGQF